MRRRIDRTSERLIEQIGRLTATIRIVLEILVLEPSHDMIMSRNRRNRIKLTWRIFYKIQNKDHQNKYNQNQATFHINNNKQ